MKYMNFRYGVLSLPQNEICHYTVFPRMFVGLFRSSRLTSAYDTMLSNYSLRFVAYVSIGSFLWFFSLKISQLLGRVMSL